MAYCEWKPVPGYDGKYEASYYGQIRRVFKRKPPHLLTPYEKQSRKKGSRYLVVHLTDSIGKTKELKVSKVIYETFGGSVPGGFSIVHKDGDFRENSFNNLVLMDREELGKSTGHKSKHKPVLKLSASLEPVTVYRSAREAARLNFMSYQTVIDRCNHKVKSRLAPDGFIYMWDEEYCYDAA